MSSDRKLAVSLGTAAVLGFATTRCDPPPTTAYLLDGGRCARDCLFCAQAQGSSAGANALSRVSWPSVDREVALKELAVAARASRFQRVCIQSTCSGSEHARIAELARDVASATALPVCASAYPASNNQVDALVSAGADVIGFGLDAATPSVYAAVKQPEMGANAGAAAWERHLNMILATAERHPGQAGAHLIVGLGESERDLVVLIQRLVNEGVVVALFAFTPVRGTAMERISPPPIGTYRRVQAALHLIRSRLVSADDLSFTRDDRIKSFAMPSSAARDLLQDGRAFQTSGCPGCNRPFYNERPGGVMYNYARPLTFNEIGRAIDEMDLD